MAYGVGLRERVVKGGRERGEKWEGESKRGRESRRGRERNRENMIIHFMHRELYEQCHGGTGVQNILGQDILCIPSLERYFYLLSSLKKP